MRNDNFFELGGHSLLAVRLIERMRACGLHTDVRTLFTTRTLAELAGAVKSESDVVVVPPNGIPAECDSIEPQMLPLVALRAAEIACIVDTVPGGASNIQDIYPLAPLQEGILFHHLLATEGDPYLDEFVRALRAARMEEFVGGVAGDDRSSRRLAGRRLCGKGYRAGASRVARGAVRGRGGCA